jgi:PAS domain S-box-containing protein
MSHQAGANLSALIESTEDLIWSVDLDYRLITFNQALCRYIEATYGIRPAAGIRLYDQFPPERAALWPRFYERVLQEGSFQTEYFSLSGRTLDLTFKPIVVEGKTAGICIFGKDITERQATEKALHNVERKYQDIFGRHRGNLSSLPRGPPPDGKPGPGADSGLRFPSGSAGCGQ